MKAGRWCGACFGRGWRQWFRWPRIVPHSQTLLAQLDGKWCWESGRRTAAAAYDDFLSDGAFPAARFR